jgi:dihydrolipoamide dehydrogenase
MVKKQVDLTVIGSGPGGYVAAIRAAQLGMKVAVVEHDKVGGVCLNWGCIPTKALLRSAEVFHLLKRSKEYGLSSDQVTFDFPQIVQRSRRIAERLSKGVEFLFKKNNIELVKGTGKLSSSHEIEVIDEQNNSLSTLQSKFILIATGARPRNLPTVQFDGKKIISSKEAMTQDHIPQSMIIIGAGAIGVEFAYFYNTFGCQITLVEMMPTILPIEDNEITQLLTNSFKKNKIAIHTETRVESISKTGNGVTVAITKNDTQQTLEAEQALIAIGVQGNSENLGIENFGVHTEKSWIKVNQSYQTSVPHIYAIGDIIGPPWLAHVASAEGIQAVENMVELTNQQINYQAIPGCTYCQPQIASIGLTEEKAIEQSYQIKIGRFPFQANGKSIALGEHQGMAKLIYDAKTNQLLGAHIIHAEATELINELSVVMKNKITEHDFIKSIHAHPTLSESIVEAAEAAYEEAIHL